MHFVSEPKTRIENVPVLESIISEVPTIPPWSVATTPDSEYTDPLCFETLTALQVDVLDSLLQGIRFKEIAKNLKISVEEVVSTKECLYDMGLSAGQHSSIEVTQKEAEVLELLLENMSNTQIAKTLSLSMNTVHYHISNIRNKYNHAQESPSEDTKSRLTRKESEVLELIGERKNSSEIAMILQISARTLHSHIINIRNKVNLHSRTELQQYAVAIKANSESVEMKPFHPIPDITRAENTVLELLIQNKTNKEIALILGNSQLTIKNHVRNILEKLQLKSRREVVQYYHNFTRDIYSCKIDRNVLIEEIVGLLSSGRLDESIARTLGVSENLVAECLTSIRSNIYNYDQIRIHYTSNDLGEFRSIETPNKHPRDHLDDDEFAVFTKIISDIPIDEIAKLLGATSTRILELYELFCMKLGVQNILELKYVASFWHLL